MSNNMTSSEDLINILDQLEEVLATARSMPMSASVLVNREQALDLVERARRAVPSAVRRAKVVLGEADAVLARGRADSDKIMQRAHEEAERLLSAESITRQAVERADQIVSVAEAKAAQLRQGADQYAERSLASLDEQVTKIAEQIRSGREVLAARAAAHSDPVPGGQQHSAPGPQRGRAGWSVDPSGG